MTIARITLIRGAYRLEPFDSEAVDRAKRVMEKYADLRIGFADASVVVLAQRHRTLDLLCTDERHFRALSVYSRIAVARRCRDFGR